MPSVNPGPASQTTVNTQSPYSPEITIQTIAVNLTPAALAASTSAEQTFAGNNTGIKAGDVILGVSPPSHVAAVVIGGYRVSPSVDDTFFIIFGNCSAGTPTPPPGLYLVTVARFNQSTRPPGSTTYGFVPTSVV